MNDRKQIVLHAAVKDYIQTAEPVASKGLQQRYGLEWSSATIRQDLSELEKDGFLQQKHTSSGRVPTDKGYRLYVDALMDVKSLPVEQQQALMQQVQFVGDNVGDVLDGVSNVMSSLIDYTVIVMAPDVFELTMSLVKLVLVDLDKVLVVLLDSVGSNKEFVMNLSDRIDQDDLNKISNLLTERLKGKTLNSMTPETFAQLVGELPQFKQVLDQLYAEIRRLNDRLSSQGRVTAKGVGNLMKLPEFKNVENIRQVISAVEETRILARLLSEGAAQQSEQVLIGKESQYEPLEECSIVMAPYHIGSSSAGSVGVLGPKRMSYSKIVPMVRQISELISNKFS